MVTKLDISIENIVKSDKTKILTLMTFAAMTLLPTGLFGNVQTKPNKLDEDIKIEQSHIEKGEEYLKKTDCKISAEERVMFFNKARFEFTKALKEGEDYCKAIRGLGLVELKISSEDTQYNLEMSVNYLEKATKCKKNEENLLNLSDAYRNSNDYKNAERCAKEILKTNDNSYKAYNKLGLIYFKQRKYNEAADKFKKAISLKPDYATAIACLADTYLNQGKHDDAMQMINKALEIEPNNPSMNWIKGLVYQKKGDVCEGIIWMQKAIELAPYADNWKGEIKKIKSQSNCR